MAEEKKCKPCGGANASSVPCEEGAIQVQVRTCIDGDWIDDWVPLGDIVQPPLFASVKETLKARKAKTEEGK